MSMLVLWLSLMALCALRGESESKTGAVALVAILLGMLVMFVRLAT